MKVKDVVLAAAKIIGLHENVAAYFDGESQTLKREAELLLECFNRVESSLALEYLPLYAEDELLTADDQVEYSSLTYAPVRILSVVNGLGEVVKFKLHPKYLKAQAGRLKITYTYTPDVKTIEDDSDFNVLASQSMLVHGVLAEYCMAEGRLDEAAVWDKKYKDAVKTLFERQSCTRLGSRRWI